MDNYIIGTHPLLYCPVSRSYKKIFLTLTYGFVFLLGLLLNSSLLWLVWSRTRSWSCSVVYMVNLAVADLLYVLALPLLIISYAMDDFWPFGNIICKVVRFFFYTNLHCGMMFLMCISVHRFLGVCYPIRALHFRTKRLAVFASTLIWALVISEVLPTLAFAKVGTINNITVCFDMTSPGEFNKYFPYGIFLTVAGFLLPFVIVLVSNCRMMRVLSQKCSRGHVGVVARCKSIRTLLVVTLVFVVCFGPYHITRTVYLFVRVYLAKNCKILNAVMLSYKIWRPLVSLHCCVNPILYFIASEKRRQFLFCPTRVHPGVWTVQVQGPKSGDHRLQN